MLELDTQTIFRTGTGDPQNPTVSFAGITGDDCVLVVRAVGMHATSSLAFTATWKGAAISTEIQSTTGDAECEIWVEALGDLVSESGDVVVSQSAGANAGVGVSATIYSGGHQTTTVRDSDVHNTADNVRQGLVDLTTVVGDIVTGAFVAESTAQTPIPGAAQNELVNWDDLGQGGLDDAVGGCSDITAVHSNEIIRYVLPTAAPINYVAVSLESLVLGPSISAVTGSRGANLPVTPSDTAIDVDVTGADAAGTTRAYLASSPNFQTATLVEQSISNITAIDLDWDDVDLGGVLAEGELYLFVVADDGGANEEPSFPFPVTVAVREILQASRLYKLDGTESGVVIVVDDLPFVPKLGAVLASSVTSRDTFEGDYTVSHVLVDRDVAMGVATAGKESPSVYKRAQRNGANSLAILDPATAGAAEHVLATCNLTDSGMEIDFGISDLAGIELRIVFLGGATCRAKVHEIEINDGSVSNLPLTLELLIGFNTGQTQGDTEDTSFSRMCIGIANGSATANQIYLANDADGTPRNSAITDGIFQRQISGTTSIWTMTITSFGGSPNNDGYSWSGTNGDSAYVAAVDLDGALSYVAMWAKESGGVDPTSEDLPDTGIDDLGMLLAFNGGRESTGPGTAFGAKWGTGVAELDGAASGMSQWLQATGTGVSESYFTVGPWQLSSAASTTVSNLGTITRFSRTPEVTWDPNAAAAILFGLLGLEQIGHSDEDVDAVFLGQLGPTGV